jgi:hypothetical protein
MNLFIQYGLLLAAPALALAQDLTMTPPNPPARVHRDMRPQVAKFNFQIQAAEPTLYSIGEPTDEAQLYLELINRARANPKAEGLRLATSTDPDVQNALKQFKVDLDVLKSEFAAFEPRPPLAMNKLLTDAARLHTEFLFETATQTHTGRGGSDLQQRVEAVGYNWYNLGENVYSYARDTFYSHDGFQVDWGVGTNGMQNPRGHRNNIHDFLVPDPLFPDEEVVINREVGIAVILGTKTVGSNTVGPHLVTQDFGTDGNNTPFVTGVAYYDLNANNFYDLGEGIGGLTVNVEGASSYAVTSASGGYAVPVPNTSATDDLAVTFTHLNTENTFKARALFNNANVKVDFKPAFVPALLTGSDAIQSGQVSNYTFNPVLGATGYKSRVVLDVDATADNADDSTRVTVNQSGAYNATSTSVKFSGNGSYHLACPAVGPQTLTYKNSFHVKAGASVSFRSRLGIAAVDQVARVEVSTNNGLAWQPVYSQAGKGSDNEGETSFQARSISLETFAGKSIQLRFNFSINSGGFFTETSDGYGWYIDDITFGNLVDTSSAEIKTLPEGTTFAFTPSVVGTHLLAVSPIISGRDLGFGSTKMVVVSSGPPSLAEIEIEEPVASGLTNKSSVVHFDIPYGDSSKVRTFTVRNSGTEDLTGLKPSFRGTHATDFVAANLGAESLAPGASTTFTVTFTPSAMGTRTAVLSIASNDANENPFEISLTGSGNFPEIEVEEPAGSGLTDERSTIQFGTLFRAQSEIRTFTVRNSGTEDLTGLSLSVSGTHAVEFVAGNLGALSLAPAASTTFTVTFTPSALGARSAVLTIASNDADENPFEISLTGTGTNKPRIDVAPTALIRREGTLTTLAVTATHPTLLQTYAWKKNGVLIKGAVTSSLRFNAVKLTDAGSYSVVVSIPRESVSIPGESIETPAVVLAVVKPIAQNFVQFAGTTIKPAVSVAGAATLTWKKTSGTPPVIEILANPTPLTLVLANLNAGTSSALYTCEARVPSGDMLIAGTFDVKVFNDKPQITLVQNMPDGQVSSTYTHQIKCDGGTALTPSSYSMSPTIPGLKLDTATGLITGKPTAPKLYTVTLTARNSRGSDSKPFPINIASLPQNVEGVYNGVIERNALLNGNLGGRVDLTVVNTGVLSGSVTLGTLKYSLTGVMDISQTAAPEATVTIKRTGTLGPLTLKFTLDTAMNRFATASLSDGTNTAQIQGWRLIWKATGTPLATSVPKLYTFALKPPALPASMPGGDGYGSFTLAKDGKLTVTGKTGDGESYTSATFAGPQGQVLLFSTLLSKGSLLGQLALPGQLDVDLATDILSGAVSWTRPRNLASRTYPLGYGPVDLTAVGGRFMAPVAPALVLGLSVGVDKAQLLFADGGLSPEPNIPDVPEFDILAKNVAKLPAALTSGNPGSVKITTLSPTTGLFSGTFVLEDTELRTGTAFAGKKLKRTGNFAGILTRFGGSPVGAGHFLLPELPRDANTGVTPPIPATTPSNSQILSGSVLMQKKPREE